MLILSFLFLFGSPSNTNIVVEIGILLDINSTSNDSIVSSIQKSVSWQTFGNFTVLNTTLEPRQTCKYDLNNEH